MNTISNPLSLEDTESARLDHIDGWEAVGMVALGATGLALMLTGVGAMVAAVAQTVGKLFV